MMKRISTFSGLLVTVMLLLGAVACRQAADSAEIPASTAPVALMGSSGMAPLPEPAAIERAIARLVTDDGCRDLTAEMRLTGTDGTGKRETIEFRLQRQFDPTATRTFLKVLAPAAEIDKALLALQASDQPTEAFSYLPGLKKLAKLNSGRTVGFRGARVTVQELLGLELGQYDYRADSLVKDEQAGELVKVVLTERSGRGLAFPKINAYFEVAGLTPVRFELLAAGGEVQKRIRVEKIEQIESRQTLTRLAIEDLAQQLNLTLELVNVDYDRGLEAAQFTTDRLKREVTAAAGRIDNTKGQ
jgi:hypothetical protein